MVYKINMHLAPHPRLLHMKFSLQLGEILHMAEMRWLHRGKSIWPFTSIFLINLNLNHQDVMLKNP